jgi:hypothetical protein
MKWEDNFKKAAVEPVINGKYWPRTMDIIHEFLASIIGYTGAHLVYVIRVEIIVPPCSS